jgi:hypothetical protein
VADGSDEIKSGDLIKNPAVALVAGTAAVAVEGDDLVAGVVDRMLGRSRSRDGAI